MESFVGRELEAITLTHFDGDYTEALSDNYLKLRLRGQHPSNKWVSSIVELVESDSLITTAMFAA